jgi:septum formation protein
MKKRKIILASTSRWRREILSYTGIPFSVVASEYEEDMTLPLPPSTLVRRFALGKALTVAKDNPNSIVIGADSVLTFRGKTLGKPKSAREARAMLRRWSGNGGMVLTAFAIVGEGGKKRVVCVNRTRVHFRRLTNSEIDTYVKTGEAQTGAGAFTISGKAAHFVDRIEGDFYTIVGLPLATLVVELRKFGVEC